MVIKRKKGSSAWLIWSLGAAFFLFEYITRVAPSVMANDLMRDFHIYGLGIGTLSALFYYPYIAMQLPVGMLVDRFGPHKLLTAMAFICAVGSAMFATATHIFIADVGRFLIGFGAAFAFVGCMKLATNWFPREQFALLAGMTQALGMVGASMGQGPMSLLVSHTGWRNAMLISGSFFVLLSVLIGLIVRDRPHHHHPVSEEVHRMVAGLWQVMKNKKSWIVCGYCGFIYASSAGFGELWGVSFLKTAYHMPNAVAASAIGLIFIGWAIGGPIMGWLSSHMSRMKLLMFSAVSGFVVFMVFIFAPTLPRWAIFSLLFYYGLTNTALVIGYALAGQINGHRLAGTSIAFSNMASVIVGATLQPILGGVLDTLWSGKLVDGVPVYSAANFKVMMMVFPVCFLIAGIFAYASKGLLAETK